MLRQQHRRQHPEAGADPAAGRGRHRRSAAADHVAERQRRRVRPGDDRPGPGPRQLRRRARLGHRAHGYRHGSPSRSRSTPSSRISARRTLTTDLPPNIEGGTPAPDSACSRAGIVEQSRWWVEPYAARRLGADAPVVAGPRRSPHRRGPHARQHPGVLPQRRAQSRLGRPPGADGTLRATPTTC